ncbi:hypothetical protein DFJ77DRAFT_467627 [Powellomyces hirtus]|nr:hypothetical protein DFJ77DRAFT_467627 [Powellomyces hirtus]
MIDTHAEQLYSGAPKDLWLTIHIIALTVITFSFWGSIYIIYQTLSKARRSRMNTSQRFPMWISATDCLFAIFHGTDHIISVSKGTLATGGLCRFLGFGMVYSMSLSAIWVTTIAFYLWSAIVRTKYLNTGKQDWRMHAICWGVPFLWNLIPFATDDYGQEVMWCGLPNRLFVFNGSVVLAALIFSGFFYGHLTYHLWAHRRALMKMNRRKRNVNKMTNGSHFNMTSGPSTSFGGSLSAISVDPYVMSSPELRQKQFAPTPINTQSEMAAANEKKLAKLVRDLPVFVVIYLIQWMPYIIYAILGVTGRFYTPLDITVVTLTNMGGVANAFAYRRFMLKDEQARPRLQRGAPRTAASASTDSEFGFR